MDINAVSQVLDSHGVRYANERQGLCDPANRDSRWLPRISSTSPPRTILLPLHGCPPQGVRRRPRGIMNLPEQAHTSVAVDVQSHGPDR